MTDWIHGKNFGFEAFTVSSGAYDADLLRQQIFEKIGRWPWLQQRATGVDVRFDAEVSQQELDDINVVIAHHNPADAPPKFRMVAQARIIGTQEEVTSDQDWETWEGIVTSLGSMIYPVENAWGRVVGKVRSVGVGGELRVIRDSDGAMCQDRVFAVPDTKNEWMNFSFGVNRNQVVGFEGYDLQARRNGAASLWVCKVSISVSEKLS
jgi:hypothetical protein